MKKLLSLTGMFAGLCIIVFGILSMCGIFGDATSYGSTTLYDSGFASFGADYYTYSVNNTANAASAASACASNLIAISNFLQFSFGLFSIGFGLAVICGFGVLYCRCNFDVASVNIGHVDESNAQADDTKTNEYEISEEIMNENIITDME